MIVQPNYKKLNLGCGNKVIQNFCNIDINPSSEYILRGDFKNLNSLKIPDNHCEYIHCENIIEYISITELPVVFQHWYSKLETGGQIFIKSIDCSVLGNTIAYEYLSINDLNNIIFGQNLLGLYNIYTVESLMKQLNMTVRHKQLVNMEFSITGQK